ncbi:MAG TPA: hypothetical protein VHW66_18455 [Stellaceae bacterium]|nr:hypothetical protein [Stellaceae bacterium]
MPGAPVAEGDAAGAAAGLGKSGDDPQEGALAASRGTKQADELAALYRQVDALQRLDVAAKALADPGQLNDRGVGQDFIPTFLFTNCSVNAFL